MPTILYPLSDDLYSDRENHLIYNLRQLLSDTDSACQLFEDAQLFAYLDMALEDINSHPMKTYYDMNSCPRDWFYLIVLGAYIFSLNTQSITEKARNFVVSDQGISYTPPDVPGHLVSIAQQMETKYQLMKEKIKANEKPSLLGIGSTRTLIPSPAYAKLRHLRERRVY